MEQSDITTKNYIDNIVKKIALKLENSYQIEANETNPDNVRYFDDNKLIWNKLSLSHGFPGICLLFGKLMECFPEEESWERIGNRYLGFVVSEINENGINDISMFSGLAGIGLATIGLSDNFKNYKNMLAAINNGINTMLPEMLQYLYSDNGTHASSYDVMAGLAGILSYLNQCRHESACYESMKLGLSELIRITQDIFVQDKKVPGWYICRENQFSQMEKEIYENGNFNTSLSHGVSGILTILAELEMDGVQMPGQREAMKRLVDFLMKSRISDNGRDIWKGQISFEEYITGIYNKDHLFRRDAWCYGVPGISYALIAAGKVINETAIIEYGINNLKLALSDLQGVYSPTFCHGYAGIYQILHSIELLLSDIVFNDEKENIKNRILGFYDENNMYGFQNTEFDFQKQCYCPYNEAGLLEGAAGVCLSLLEAEHPDNSVWKRAFLLV